MSGTPPRGVHGGQTFGARVWSGLKQTQGHSRLKDWNPLSRSLRARAVIVKGAKCRTMTNIASALKSEISRIARKEVRAEIDSLKKASAQHRGAIAQLRREVTELTRKLRQADRAAQSSSRAAVRQSGDTPRRFSSSRLAAHRAKLGLSAAAYGKLVGMSGATIYLWEQGKSRPDAEQLLRLAAVRLLSRRAALEQVSG